MIPTNRIYVSSFLFLLTSSDWWVFCPLCYDLRCSMDFFLLWLRLVCFLRASPYSSHPPTFTFNISARRPIRREFFFRLMELLRREKWSSLYHWGLNFTLTLCKKMGPHIFPQLSILLVLIFEAFQLQIILCIFLKEMSSSFCIGLFKRKCPARDLALKMWNKITGGLGEGGSNPPTRYFRKVKIKKKK